MFNLFWYITGKNRRFYKMPIWIIWGQILNLSPRFPEPFNVFRGHKRRGIKRNVT